MYKVSACQTPVIHEGLQYEARLGSNLDNVELAAEHRMWTDDVKR